MNELTTKEQAMQAVGATREASYKAIVAGLSSKKLTVDKNGDEHWEEDTTNRLRSAELIARMNGDLRPETMVDNRSVTINAGGMSSELLEMVKDVKEQLGRLKVSGHQTGEIIDIQASIS